jgi:hypothetical protein
MLTCVECGDDYQWDKSRAMLGGKRTHCSDCAEETSVKYAGVSAGEGKGASVQILKFETDSDRGVYLDAWAVNSGLYKSKSCQIGRGLKSTPNVKFETRATFTFNPNHKG